MSDAVLIDTDVLVDYMRGHPDAVAFIEPQLPGAKISVVTVAELLAGVRDSEMRRLRDLLDACTQLDVTRDIAERGGLFRRTHLRAVRIGTPDALIAATAQEHGLLLATLNRKHFPTLNILTPYVKG